MNAKEGVLATPPKSQIKLQVRFSSEELHEALKELARDDERSLNGEIMQALREFISHRKEPTRQWQ